MPSAGDYTMRAQPRRRKESTSKGDEPVFLRKTYEMISSCDPDLATWSPRGDTFVIKDPDLFAANVIPTFFKHSKFSSFVRQLNFYGFRKVKSALTVEEEQADSSQWWEFKHDMFLRDQPHLLSEIKRATHYSTAPEKEVDALKGEVSSLHERITTMDDRINHLTALVDALIRERNTGVPLATPAPAAYAMDADAGYPKKRKYGNSSAGSSSSGASVGMSMYAGDSEHMNGMYGGSSSSDTGAAFIKQELPYGTAGSSSSTHMYIPASSNDMLSSDGESDSGIGDSASNSIHVTGGGGSISRLMSVSSDGAASFLNGDLLDSLGMSGAFDFMDFDTYMPTLSPKASGAGAAAATGDMSMGMSTADSVMNSGSGEAFAVEPTVSVVPGIADATMPPVNDNIVTAAAAVEAVAPAAEVADLAMSLSALPPTAQEQLAEGLKAIITNTQTVPAPTSGTAIDAAAGVATPAPATTVTGLLNASKAPAHMAMDSRKYTAASANAVPNVNVADSSSVVSGSATIITPITAAAAAAAAPQAPEIAMPLASAALGAFLTRFASTQGLSDPLLTRTLSVSSAASEVHQRFVSVTPRQQRVA